MMANLLNSETMNQNLSEHATNEVIIKSDGLTESSNIQIFDITGKLILQQEYQVDDKIDISSLTTGMYILNIRNSEGVSSKKIIKQ